MRLLIWKQPAHELGKFVSPTHRLPLTPTKYSLYSLLLEAQSTTMTSSGIETATFRLVVQCLNQQCHPVCPLFQYMAPLNPALLIQVNVFPITSSSISVLFNFHGNFGFYRHSLNFTCLFLKTPHFRNKHKIIADIQIQKVQQQSCFGKPCILEHTIRL
jgi:hypothetical protein